MNLGFCQFTKSTRDSTSSLDDDAFNESRLTSVQPILATKGLLPINITTKTSTAWEIMLVMGLCWVCSAICEGHWESAKMCQRIAGTARDCHALPGSGSTECWKQGNYWFDQGDIWGATVLHPEQITFFIKYFSYFRK